MTLHFRQIGVSQQRASMAAITEDECRRLKLLRIIETAGQSVLTYTLQCGTKGKPSTITLLEYLDNLPQNSAANYTRVKDTFKCFNKTDKDQINGDPTCTTFDVTLLCKAIKLACENVADPNKMENAAGPSGKVHHVNVWTSSMLLTGYELEQYTTSIKNTRNAVVHEGQPLDETAFLKEVDKLRDLFNNCLKATKDRYKRDDAEHQSKRAAVQAKVTDIQQETLGIGDILQRSAASILPGFKQEIDQELTAGLSSAKYLTPLHFLSGIPKNRVEVNDIFCDITLAEEKEAAPQGYVHKVPHLEVLQLCEESTESTSGQSGQALPQVLVVEGEVGSGKTTWACFVVQQWLTPQDRRRMQGLQRYDLLLRVVCRERTSSSLEGFVQQLLPESHLRYRRLLLPLLKKCRVLVIIDGIDEINDVSRSLVESILNETATTTFTVVCTSRPHSVQDLKVEARGMHFQVVHVRMLGISNDTHRMELVVRHYQWLCAATNSVTDTDALKQAAEDIVWRDVFRLPLNLLFVATVFFYEPQRVSSNLSQSDLYQQIHTWCREKLQARLGSPSQEGPDRVSRQAAVERVLDVIHKLALKGLLQNRVCLNDQDLQDVECACTTESLDSDAVLSAFYCMRREVTAGVVRETYMVPHKSLQEFMAAKCIAGQVKQYSKGAIERVLRGYKAGEDPALRQLRQAIKRVLRGSTARQNPPLRQQRQILVHLLSLLTGQDDAMKEAMDLLHRSGLIDIDHWLRLLTDAMAPDAVVQHAAEQLVARGIDGDRVIMVWDDRVHVASVMLQHLPRRELMVWLRREVTDVDSLARALARHKVTDLRLYHHWMHPCQHAASATLLRGAQGNDLKDFRGHLDSEDLVLLPRCLEWLYLVVREDRHAQSLLPALAEARRSMPHLSTITLHIPVTAVTPAALTRLPADSGLDLYLSGVTDLLVEAAVDILAAVCPPEQGFRELSFPEATLDLKGWEDLFSRLQQAGVTVKSEVEVPDTHVTQNQEWQLNTLAKTMLGCGKVTRDSNEHLWLL